MASTVSVADPTSAMAPLAPALTGSSPAIASLKAEGKHADLSASAATVSTNLPPSAAAAAAAMAQLEGIKVRSEAAAAIKTAALARQRDAKTDRMVERLKDGDEQLADLLSQAADSLSALLPRRPISQIQGSGVRNDPDDQEETDAEAFEKKAQDWFAALNDVQTNMRAAVHHLRQANVPPLTMNASAASRAKGQLGSAERGTDLRLLSTFIDTGSSSSRSDGASSSSSATATAPAPAPAPAGSSRVGAGEAESTSLTSSFSNAPKGRSPSSTETPTPRPRRPSAAAAETDSQRTPVGSIYGGTPEPTSRTGYFDDAADSASLSVSALRLQERGWKGLSKALEDIDLQRRVEKGVGASKLARVDSSTSVTKGKGRKVPASETPKSKRNGKARAGNSENVAAEEKEEEEDDDGDEEEDEESSSEVERQRMERAADQAAEKIFDRKTTSDTRLIEALFKSAGMASASPTLQQLAQQRSSSRR